MPNPESGKKRAGKPLRVAEATAIGGAMKIRHISAVLAIALLAGCDKPAEVTVDESRSVTMRDEGLKLNASSNDRFQEPGTGPLIAGTVPGSWLAQPSSSFRLLSYRFGTGGDVAVGISAGGLLENVNRWLGQFGQDPRPLRLGEARPAGDLGQGAPAAEAQARGRIDGAYLDAGAGHGAGKTRDR